MTAPGRRLGQWIKGATDQKRQSRSKSLNRSSLTSLLLLLVVIMLLLVKQTTGWGVVILISWGAIAALGCRISPVIRRLFNLTLCLLCFTLLIEQPKLEVAKGFDLSAPPSLTKLPNLSIWATYYYLHQGQAVDQGIPLLDMTEHPLEVSLSPKDWCVAAVQGSLQVLEDTNVVGTFTFAGVGAKAHVDCAHYYPQLSGISVISRTRFLRTKSPYGEGIKGYQLVPYRTVAVDETVIPIGSILYVPAARGVTITLPSGEQVTHDGYFYAADVGGAVHGNHIDIFSGLTDRPPFPFVKSKSSTTVNAYLINDPVIDQKLTPLHQSVSSTSQTG
ncbi:MAG: 3D domain-containing protein [Leptolyngbyaceae cyanobacterium]